MDAHRPVSVEEYLRTSYPDADREYIDGRIVERNVGEVDHSDLQTAIAHYLRTHYKKRVWAGVPRWHPHQPRHALATEVRKPFGIEASRVVLGHRDVRATQVYAQEDRRKGVEVMRRIAEESRR